MEDKLNILDILKDSKSYFEDFISRSTYHSNAIEGSTLSFAETYALLFDSKYSNITNADAKEIHEALNHKYAHNLIIDRIDNNISTIDEEFLTSINQTINKNIIFVGGYRLGKIRIRGSEKEFPLPQHLNDKMNLFYDEFNKKFELDVDMMGLAEMHLKYENIHPYPDGNGRTGRLLINYFLMLNNQVPIVIPFEKRSQYLKMMEDNDILGLCNMFKQLQEKEMIRIRDFLEMDKEKNRQKKNSREM
ncbi:MAG: Fic family protein [Erysipelotrichaceae bacterium]